MRSTSNAWRALIGYSHQVVTVVESWLGSTQLATRVPMTTGSIAFDDTAIAKRRLTMTVPARTPGMRWDPAGNVTHPLAAYGQRLHVFSGIAYANKSIELMDLGWYLITGWKRDEDAAAISIEAWDLARLITDDRLLSPVSPATGATFAGMVRSLVEATGLQLVVDPAVVDRVIGSTPVWDRERDRAISDLCDAWPARWAVGDDGRVHVLPPYSLVTASTTPDADLTDGGTGTITGRAREADRGAIYNTIVVTGRTPDDGSPVPYAVAAVTDPGSPIRITGPYGRVPRFYASDLITTQAQAQAAADSQLVTYTSAGRSEPVKAVPDPSLQLGDVVRISTRDGDRYTARVTALTLPLTAQQGPMQVTASMTPAGVV